jgi:hypothetical protein
MIPNRVYLGGHRVERIAEKQKLPKRELTDGFSEQIKETKAKLKSWSKPKRDRERESKVEIDLPSYSR